MKHLIMIGLAALAMWAYSMFGGDKEMSLDYVPRYAEDYSRGDDMESMFQDWISKHKEGDNSLDYRPRYDSGRNNSLDYRGRSTRTGRYVHRSR